MARERGTKKKEELKTVGLVAKLRNLVEDATKYSEKFDSGVKKYGTELRKTLQDIKSLSQEIRNTVTTMKKES